MGTLKPGHGEDGHVTPKLPLVGAPVHRSVNQAPLVDGQEKRLNSREVIHRASKDRKINRETEIKASERYDLHLSGSGSESVSHSVVSNSATPWTVAHPGSTKQEDWSGLQFLLRGSSPTLGLNLGLPHCTLILYCLKAR